MIKFFTAFGRFWYEFIIGDDWKIAAGVVLTLAITLGLDKVGLPEQVVTIVGAALVLAAFVTALVIDIRPRSRSTRRQR